MIYESKNISIPKIKGLPRVKALIEKYNPLTACNEPVEVEGILSLDGWGENIAWKNHQKLYTFSVVLLVCELNVDCVCFSGSLTSDNFSTLLTPKKYTDFKILKVLSDED